ncbi:MAG TPA: signal recognition particle-docking protein FtsY [Blastocatellia bacterium]|jgi:fused signal recognition particle receptor|nr:signal recognition particle-docking protein FtsY [Blastocatellia bacterium]
MGLFWRRKKEDFISLGLSAPDEAPSGLADEARAEEAERIEQIAQWKRESAPVIAEPEVAEQVTAEPETVEPVGISVEQWAAEAAKLFEPSSHAGAQPVRLSAAKSAVEERVVEWVEAPVEEESFFSRFRKAVSATRENIASRIEDVVKGRKQIDEATLEEIEEVLIGADIGVQTTLEIIEDVRRQVSRQTLKDVDELKRVIKDHLLEILDRAERARGVASEAALREDVRPYVLMVVGVNGTGKTTTIGKLANRIKADGYDVLICAADTFRAAASDQLAIWAERAGVPLVQQKQGTDPAAVLFDSLKAAKARNADVLIVDTAGRLHTKANLMAELEKMKRVAGREVEGAPHETLLVVDAVTGQNGLSQAREFLKVANVTGLVLTKLDGTAKGGIAVAIAKDLNLPIRYCGIGEKTDDLIIFDPKAYVDGLFE